VRILLARPSRLSCLFLSVAPLLLLLLPPPSPPLFSLSGQLGRGALSIRKQMNKSRPAPEKGFVYRLENISHLEIYLAPARRPLRSRRAAGLIGSDRAAAAPAPNKGVMA
jgi:hypothetical protein